MEQTLIDAQMEMNKIELTLMENDALQYILLHSKFKTVLVEDIDKQLADEENCEAYKKTLNNLKNKIIKFYKIINKVNK